MFFLIDYSILLIKSTEFIDTKKRGKNGLFSRIVEKHGGKEVTKMIERVNDKMRLFVSEKGKVRRVVTEKKIHFIANAKTSHWVTPKQKDGVRYFQVDQGKIYF